MNPPGSSAEIIAERACVLRVNGDVAWVRCETQSGCARCAAGQGCGGGLFSRLLRGRLQELPVTTEIAVQPGDWVLIGLSTSAVQNASALLYGCPLAGLLAGTIIGSQLSPGDATTLIGLAAGLAAGLVLAHRLATRLAGKSALQPVLLRRLNEHEPCPAGAQA